MANELITLQELATWTQTPLATVQEDPFALEVFEKTSQLVKEIAEQPEWTIETAPFRVRLLTLKIAKRTYENPGQEVSSTTGPISSRVLDIAAMAMDLSEEEMELLLSHRPDGAGEDGLWVLSMTRGDDLLKTVYLPAEPQPNLGNERPWMIPYGDTDETDAFTESGDVYVP